MFKQTPASRAAHKHTDGLRRVIHTHGGAFQIRRRHFRHDRRQAGLQNIEADKIHHQRYADGQKRSLAGINTA